MAEQNGYLKEEERWAERYALFVVRYRWPIIISLLIVTLIFGFFIKDLDIRNDPDTLLPASNRYVATNLYGEHNFGMGNLMVFVLKVKQGDIYQPWFINKVQALHRKLVALPTSRESNFIDLAAQKIKFMGADENGLVFKRLIPTSGISTDDPQLAQQQLAFLKEGVETNPVMGPMLAYMEDPQGNRCEYGEYEQKGCVAKAAYIIGDYTDEVKEIYLPWVKEVRLLMDEYGQDERIEVLVAGEPYFLAWMLQELVNKWWLFLISIIIVVAVLWYEFRNWRGALFPLLGVGATIALTLGLMGFSQFKLTTMMVLTPMLLLAIGIGHSVQVTRRFMLEQDANGGDCERAAVVAISHMIVPATLSIVTDMVGFATLSLVDISFYKAYAYFGMFGMLTLLVTTTTLIPLLMMSFPCTQGAGKQQGHGWESTVGGAITRLIAGPGKWIPLGIVVLIIGISAHFTGITKGSWENPMPGVERGIDYSRAAFKKSSITIEHILKLNEVMPGVISVSIPIRGKQALKPECDFDGNPQGCHDPEEDGAQGIFNDAEVLADIEKLENWMRAHPSIGFTGSYAQYVRLINMLLTTEVGEKPQIRDLRIPTREYLTSIDPEDDRDPNEMVQLFNGLLETMTSEGDMDSFISADWNEGIILGFVNTMDPVETHQVTMDIQQYIEDHKNAPGFSKVNFGLRNEDTSGDGNALSVEGSNYVRPGVGGFLGATEATREVAEDNWLKGPMQTALAVFIITALIFRSLAVSVILLTLLFITLFAQYGLGGYFTSVGNWSGNLAFHLQVTLSIAMGLGIDYGIYMISRLREEMARTGGQWLESLRNTQNTTGSAVIISVIVLLGSFIPLLSTNLANTWGLGIYIGQALLIDVVTALTLLPLMVYWFKPKFVFGDHRN
ncbi:MAG: MMPL family transporter [Gammaproteobacteria bacterium]|nr:MMPL family transporter [Gammaproteobacteria bacterium]